MKDARNIPAIRFKEFSGAWEQRKFSEITFPSGVKNKDNLPLESYSITNENGFIPQDEKFENGGTMREADKRMYYIVTPNTFAYNPARINVGSIGYYDKQSNVIVSSLYEVFRTISDVYDRFLWHWFKTAIFQRCIEQLQEGGVRLYFYYDKLCQCSILLPSYEEQKLIGDELDHIDALITLHQRKIDALKTLKKALLAEMFPDNGSDKPLLRFKGFNDAWEQRKLEQEVIFSKGSGYSKADLSAEGLPLILYGRLYTNYESEITNVDTFAAQKTGTVFSSGNEVIVPASGETAEDIARASAVKVKGCMLGGDLNILMPKSNIDSTFLAISISNGEVSKKLACMAQGKSVVHIHNSDIEQLEIPFPSLTEQVRIVGVFRHIDTLITLHQHKLEGLKTMKTFLLQNMFI